MNEEITYQVLQACISCGVREFIVCAGSRNSSFVEVLRIEKRLKTYYWPEERSGAFFALGRSRLTKRAVAIVTTSGTAAAELLPAAMEAFYTGVPLILITADRPPNFRGSGAPQSAEQVGLYGSYVQFSLDMTPESRCSLKDWTQKIPVHINVCLAEPQKQPAFMGRELLWEGECDRKEALDFEEQAKKLNGFLEEVKHPMAIVSALRPDAKEEVAKLLLKLQIPSMIEAISGLREDPRLQHLSIQRTDKVLETAEQFGYPVDGILRIGGIPTHRIWRDLEYLEDKIKVCGLSAQPFSGLSWNRTVAEGPIHKLLKNYTPGKCFDLSGAEKWLEAEQAFHLRLQALFHEEPYAEPSLIYALSKEIPQSAHIYLGNSLPIREWDMAAVRKERGWVVEASRGVNGIDGQLSTFLGLCQQGRENWGIFGDLTALYDMVGPWILSQLGNLSIKIVIVNNGGGKIFQRMYPYKEMLNEHRLSFRPLAEMWGLDYQKLTSFQEISLKEAPQMIEIVPDEAATARFWSKYGKIDQEVLAYASNV